MIESEPQAGGRARPAHDPGGRADEPRNEARERGGGSTSVWEWIVAAVGALLVVGAIGIMLTEAFGEPRTPPAIRIEVTSVRESGTGFHVELLVHNEGHRTASALTLEGTLTSDTGVVETAEATIAYVPARARRYGGLFFTRDPRRYTLEVRPGGYDRP